MPSIQDIRQQYPQYSDMSDQQLADALHAKYYSDMPQQQFYQKIGLNTQAPVSAPAQGQSFLSNFSPQQLIGSVNTLGGQLAHGLGQGVMNIANIPGALMGHPDMFQFPQAPFVNQNDIVGKAVNAVSQFAVPGGLAAKGVEGTQLAANPLVQRALIGGITGFAGSPGDISNRTTGATVGAALPIAVAGAGMVAKGTADMGTVMKNAITGGDNQGIATDIYQKLTKGLKPDELNSQNFNNIKQNYTQQVQNIGGGFNQLGQNAAERGYAMSGDPQFSIGNKFFNPSNTLKSQLNNLTKSDKIDDDATDLIKQYIQTPTYDNAHQLQSILGKQAADLKTGVPSPQDIKLSNNIMNIRNSLLDNVKNTFEQYGDNDLANQYSQLRQDWKNNVIPYQKVSPIWNAISKGKPFQNNVINTLDNDDFADSAQTIRDHLLQNPDHARSVMAQAVSNAGQITGQGLKVDPNKLENIFYNTPSTIDQFKTPSLQQQMQMLSDTNARVANRAPILRRSAIGALGIAGLGGISHLLGGL